MRSYSRHSNFETGVACMYSLHFFSQYAKDPEPTYCIVPAAGFLRYFARPELEDWIVQHAAILVQKWNEEPVATKWPMAWRDAMAVDRYNEGTPNALETRFELVVSSFNFWKQNRANPDAVITVPDLKIQIKMRTSHGIANMRDRRKVRDGFRSDLVAYNKSYDEFLELMQSEAFKKVRLGAAVDVEGLLKKYGGRPLDEKPELIKCSLEALKMTKVPGLVSMLEMEMEADGGGGGGGGAGLFNDKDNGKDDDGDDDDDDEDGEIVFTKGREIPEESSQVF